MRLGPKSLVIFFSELSKVFRAPFGPLSCDLCFSYACMSYNFILLLLIKVEIHCRNFKLGSTCRNKRRNTNQVLKLNLLTNKGEQKKIESKFFFSVILDEAFQQMTLKFLGLRKRFCIDYPIN